jgi:uncharacterized protein YlzI (FlbEa/FlbD family)
MLELSLAGVAGAAGLTVWVNRFHISSMMYVAAVNTITLNNGHQYMVRDTPQEIMYMIDSEKEKTASCS